MIVFPSVSDHKNSCCYQSVSFGCSFLPDKGLTLESRFIPPAKRAVRVGIAAICFDSLLTILS